MTAAEDYVVSLMAAALHGRKAAAKPDGVDWAQVYRLASRHSIEPLVFPALSEQQLHDMPSQMSQRWQQDEDMTLYRQLSYDVEREALLADFRKAGLSWLPLKGIMVATYYPQPGMRSMSDQDIMFGFVEPDGKGGWKARGGTDEERALWLRKADSTMTSIMLAHGFSEFGDAGREHSFVKTQLHFEMHRSLLSAAELSTNKVGIAELRYFENPWLLAKPSGNPPTEFRFGREDEYVFHVSHMSKHYRSSGFGLRFLADEYLYCTEFPDAVSSGYARGCLANLGLVELEHDVRELAMALFDHPNSWRGHVSPREVVLFNEVVSGGVYGSLEHRVKQSLRRQVAGDGGKPSSLRYWWGRVFPPRDWVAAYYPEWSGNPLSRFVLAFVRLYRGLRNHPGILRSELRLVSRSRKRR